jgi:HK97 family phage major capsid protein
MPDVTQEQIDSLNNGLADIQKLATERIEAQEKVGTDLGEKIDAQVKAATDLTTKFEGLEKQQKAADEKNELLEKTIARFQQNGGGAESEEKAEEFLSVIKSVQGSVANGFELNADKLKTYKKGFDLYFKKGEKGLAYSGMDAEELKFINTIIDPQGGYLVAPEYNFNVTPKAFDGRAIVEIARRMTTGSNEYIEVIDAADYEDAAWSNELSDAPSDQNNEDFRELRYNPTEQIYTKKISRNALEDQFTSVDYHLAQMNKGAVREAADDFLNGNGVDKPRGFLTYDSGTGVTGQVEQITSSDAGVLTWDDVLSLLPKSLKDDYHNNAKYLMRRQAFFELLIDKDGQSRYQIGNQINFFDASGVSLSILGSPVKWDAGMPAVAANALSVAYGDFNEAYQIVDRVGFSIIRDETNPKFIVMNLRRRLTGGLRVGEAAKILKIKA